MPANDERIFYVRMYVMWAECIASCIHGAPYARRHHAYNVLCVRMCFGQCTNVSLQLECITFVLKSTVANTFLGTNFKWQCCKRFIVFYANLITFIENNKSVSLIKCVNYSIIT